MGRIMQGTHDPNLVRGHIDRGHIAKHRFLNGILVWGGRAFFR